MKSFSLTALTALFFVVAVSAAPQNAPELTIEDVTFDVVKKSISFDEVMKALRCIREVIGNAVTVNPNLKPLYEEYKQKAELLVKSELMKCQDIKDGQEKVTCVMNAVHKIETLFYEFIEKVTKMNSEIAEKIKMEVKGKCLKDTSFIAADTYAKSVREQFLCAVTALGSASTRNGMTNEWKKYEPKFFEHLALWKKCENVNDKLKKIVCNIKEGAYMFGLFVEYGKSIAGHPNFQKLVQDYNTILRQKCTA